MSAGGAGLQNVLTCLVNIGPDISIKSIYVARRRCEIKPKYCKLSRPGKEKSFIFFTSLSII